MSAPCNEGSCSSCREDLQFLRRKHQPNPPKKPSWTLRAVDMFAGCGGMSIGLAEAARRAHAAFEVPLAIDADQAVIDLYEQNLPGAKTKVGDVAELFPGDVGSKKTKTETKIKAGIGDIDVLLGGPPCQGHSDLNNHTRRRDPKNELYLLMARAAEVLEPQVVVIENVTPVQWDHGKVVERTSRALEEAGYRVHGCVLDLRRVGVPQQRRRYVLLASKLASFDPRGELEAITDTATHPHRTVGWAIGDLRGKGGTTPFDTASRPTDENKRRIDLLFETKAHDLPNEERPECHRDREHSYRSMYGRLWWDKPAQTITTGFGSMGQGRFVHPKERRTITPHEAARLQTFPDWYDFGADTKRGVLAKVIGNAVPPLLMVKLGARIIAALTAERPRSARQPA